MARIKKYWFFIALIAVVLVTVADGSGTVSGAGRWLNLHFGPSTSIFIVFLISGILLNAVDVRRGIMDMKGTLTALSLILIVSPLLATMWGLLPVHIGIQIGIFLVATMPSTLSSGVVMTGASGGNAAHALMITILANGISVFTIPVSLSLLLKLIGDQAVVVIDKPAMMIKIGLLVVLPLLIGLAINYFFRVNQHRWGGPLTLINQILIVNIVWMAVSRARADILESVQSLGMVVVSVSVFHLLLLAAAWAAIRCLKVPKGRRESILFMGCQKTLPLSIIIQVSLFPQHGIALVVCVLHHLIHLMMDGYVVGRLKNLA